MLSRLCYSMCSRKTCIWLLGIAVTFLFVTYELLRNISALESELDCYISAQDRKIMLNLFRKFQDRINRYNLTCWLNFGTLIGSYRYENILPWDKDLDMGCLEKDGKRLKEIIVPELIREDISVEFHGEHYFRLVVSLDVIQTRMGSKLKSLNYSLTPETEINSSFRNKKICSGSKVN